MTKQQLILSIVYQCLKDLSNLSLIESAIFKITPYDIELKKKVIILFNFKTNKITIKDYLAVD